MNTSNDTSIIDRQAFLAAQRSQWDRAAAGWDAHGPALHAWLQ